MRVGVEVVRRAGDAFVAMGLAERRRAALLGGVNFLAVMLGLGALHLGGALVTGSDDHRLASPAPEAAAPAKTALSIPHPASSPLAAVPDDITLFGAPVVAPTGFNASPSMSPGNGNVTAPPATGLGPSPTAVAAETPPHAVAVPQAKAVTKLAAVVPAVHHAVVAAAVGPLALSDAMLDAPVGLTAAANTGVATVANGVAATVNGVAATAGGVAAGVSGIAAGVSAGVSGTTAGVASAASGVASAASSAAAGVSAGVGAAAGAR